jgi:regulator of sirC expression with transglutaminase-like and TPR domain
MADMSDPESIRLTFERVMSQPEPALNLARAALLVAVEADPAVDVEQEMRTLDDWGHELSTRIDPQWNNLQKLARLRNYLFDDLGFRGDAKDYYNPSNSLLHEVMRRRRGVPLTLSILFMELGWRVGIPFEGVAFPGHFLVRLSGEPGDLLLDPFQHGVSVHEDDCQRMLLEATGGRVDFDPRLTASVGKRDMIVRLLHNLKGAYLRASDDLGALGAVERLLLLSPDDPEETRDRGLLLYRLHRYGTALDSLEAYIVARPAARDRDQVQSHVASLRQVLAGLN